MDSKGGDIKKLPGIVGFNATRIGAWSDDGSKYTYIAKPVFGNGDRLAVVYFDEDTAEAVAYAPEGIVTFPDSSTIRWAGDSSVSVDIGTDFVDISLE
jgi:hypothetical protein